MFNNFFKNNTFFPKRNPEKNDISHLLYLLILPLYLFLFFLAEHLITDNYWVSFMPLDNYIPFCEWFIIPYCLWYPFMLFMGLYLIINDKLGFKKFMSFIGLSFITSVAIFLIFPTGQNLRPEAFQNNNLFTAIISSLYKSDTNTNVLPSLHVVGSLAVPFAAQNNKKLKKPLILIALYTVAFFITASTVLIKQHSILDVFVAIPYAAVFYIIVYKFMFKKQTKKALQ